uniref:A-kinase anchor protein 2 C-terminal domain-containing protein n=1 Tax=Latimeria chalumnae TaxID=7897 RepID=H3A846_LATCH
TLRKEATYELRAYQEERKPTKLFSDNDEETKYKVVTTCVSPKKADLENERREVIKLQAPKRSSAIAERWSSLDELNIEKSDPADTSKDHMKMMSDSLTSGLALSYGPGSTLSAEYYTVNPESIDTEQINFSAARQQFLTEQPQSPIIASPRQFKVAELPEFSKDLCEKNWPMSDTQVSSVKAVEVHCGCDENKDHQNEQNGGGFTKRNKKDGMLTAEKATGGRSHSSLKHALIASASIDDLDSGLGELSNDIGAGYISDSSASNEVFCFTLDISSTPEPIPEQKMNSETPIEKEIRLAVEREENLHRSGTPESIPDEKMKNETPIEKEIRLAVESSASEEVFCNASDRSGTPESIPDEKMKNETPIEKEIRLAVEREENLQPSLYLYTTSSSLERKPNVTFKHEPLQENNQRISNTATKKEVSEMLPAHPVHSYSSDLCNSHVQESPTGTCVRTSTSSYATDRSHSSIEPFTLKTPKLRTSLMIEKEIQESLKREDELREHRKSRLLSEGLSPNNACSKPSGTASHNSGMRTRLGSSDVFLLPESSPNVLTSESRGGSKGLTATLLHDFEERKIKLRKEEGCELYFLLWVLNSTITLKVLEATRVTRRKSERALRWEAGVFANENENE